MLRDLIFENWAVILPVIIIRMIAVVFNFLKKYYLLIIHNFYITINSFPTKLATYSLINYPQALFASYLKLPDNKIFCLTKEGGTWHNDMNKRIWRLFFDINNAFLISFLLFKIEIVGAKFYFYKTLYISGKILDGCQETVVREHWRTYCWHGFC